MQEDLGVKANQPYLVVSLISSRQQEALSQTNKRSSAKTKVVWKTLLETHYFVKFLLLLFVCSLRSLSTGILHGQTMPSLEYLGDWMKILISGTEYLPVSYVLVKEAPEVLSLFLVAHQNLIVFNWKLCSSLTLPHSSPPPLRHSLGSQPPVLPFQTLLLSQGCVLPILPATQDLVTRSALCFLSCLPES